MLQTRFRYVNKRRLKYLCFLTGIYLQRFLIKWPFIYLTELFKQIKHPSTLKKSLKQLFLCCYQVECPDNLTAGRQCSLCIETFYLLLLLLNNNFFHIIVVVDVSASHSCSFSFKRVAHFCFKLFDQLQTRCCNLTYLSWQIRESCFGVCMI